MNITKKAFLLSFLIVFISSSLFGQEQEHSGLLEIDKDKKGYVSLVLGHAFIPAGEHETENERVLFVPTWGVHLGFFVGKRYAIVWTNEVHIQQYVIKNDNFEDLVREYPFITGVEFQYYITHNLAFMAGPGIELEKNRNFFVFRVGFEGEFEMGNSWAFIPAISYETKEGELEPFLYHLEQQGFSRIYYQLGFFESVLPLDSVFVFLLPVAPFMDVEETFLDSNLFSRLTS